MPSYKCPNCDQFLNSIDLLEEHAANQHAHLLPFKCGQCGRKTATAQGLLKHYHIHHGTNNKHQQQESYGHGVTKTEAVDMKISPGSMAKKLSTKTPPVTKKRPPAAVEEVIMLDDDEVSPSSRLCSPTRRTSILNLRAAGDTTAGGGGQRLSITAEAVASTPIEHLSGDSSQTYIVLDQANASPSRQSAKTTSLRPLSNSLVPSTQFGTTSGIINGVEVNAESDADEQENIGGLQRRHSVPTQSVIRNGQLRFYPRHVYYMEEAAEPEAKTSQRRHNGMLPCLEMKLPVADFNLEDLFAELDQSLQEQAEKDRRAAILREGKAAKRRHTFSAAVGRMGHGAPSVVTCLECHKSFDTDDRVCEHLKRRYPCEMADAEAESIKREVFETITSLGTPTQLAYENQYVEKTGHIRCKLCHRTYKHQQTMNEHMELHRRLKGFNCDQCKMHFLEAPDLEKHKIMHSGDRRFACDLCPKRFAHRFHLDVHMRAHTGEKPYKCDWQGCKKAFGTADGLKRHTRLHTGERPYECGFCGQRFSESGPLRIHERIHTGHQKLKCEEPGCNKVFAHKISLQKHRRVHTGERPFICEFCGFAFSRQDVLTVHRRIHTGENMQECSTCGRQFVQRSDLRKHMARWHDVDLDLIDA